MNQKSSLPQQPDPVPLALVPDTLWRKLGARFPGAAL
jgi:hypothetical protein